MMTPTIISLWQSIVVYSTAGIVKATLKHRKALPLHCRNNVLALLTSTLTCNCEHMKL